ncbi:hypothetical protein OKW21_005335 [Catalinimonas alkaloidigena]|uniref:hypothetical protein n=1 Tax=Catalinimonas alkaloidigena TaxID=1075417 RepID=UPI0024053A0D|nr:hypothetical protein [Catalinimonas alkaloidigena]MDF9800072.1 hypothetical protein [Catalinimonas alkaloidigena]
MDILRKVLLIAFYVCIIAAGVVGFLTLRSMRQIPAPVQDSLQQQNIAPSSDSTISTIYPVVEEDTALVE